MATKTKTRPALKAKKPTRPAGKAKSKAKPAKAVKKQPRAESKPHSANGAICHVEFTTPDLTQAQAFYGALFGWQFQGYKPTEMYFMTAQQGGVCGCMLEGPAANDARTMIYANVDDIAATLAKAGALGATTVKAKTEIPGGHGSFAQLKAPDGNVWGLYSGE